MRTDFRFNFNLELNLTFACKSLIQTIRDSDSTDFSVRIRLSMLDTRRNRVAAFLLRYGGFFLYCLRV